MMNRIHKACVSQFYLTYDMADYFKNLYGNRIKINKDSCEKVNFPKNIYKSIKIDINVFPTNRDGLNILPDVYGVNLETNTGCILEKTNIPHACKSHKHKQQTDNSCVSLTYPAHLPN